jgi:ribosome-interacting GTPase 1
MPANLPPAYFEAEKRLREARTPAEKIEVLEEMLTIMPKHKGTDKLRADLRRKISRLRTQPQKKGAVSRRNSAYNIDKEGAGQVVIIGPPNSGKSSLVATLTNAKPEIAAFPHTTWTPAPGMAQYENIKFQLIDTPPMTPDFIEPWMGDILRRSDMVVLVLDLHSDPLEQSDRVLSVLRDLGIFPEGFPAPVDVKAPVEKKILVLVNKTDGEKDREDFGVFIELWETKLPCLGVSSKTGYNLKRFLEMVYETLGIIRVYTKAPGKKPDFEHPFTLPKNSTLEELAAKVHKDFLMDLKFARVWGDSVFDGQKVQKDHVLGEGDVVEMHI